MLFVFLSSLLFPLHDLILYGTIRSQQVSQLKTAFTSLDLRYDLYLINNVAIIVNDNWHSSLWKCVIGECQCVVNSFVFTIFSPKEMVQQNAEKQRNQRKRKGAGRSDVGPYWLVVLNDDKLHCRLVKC